MGAVWEKPTSHVQRGHPTHYLLLGMFPLASPRGRTIPTTLFPALASSSSCHTCVVWDLWLCPGCLRVKLIALELCPFVLHRNPHCPPAAEGHCQQGVWPGSDGGGTTLEPSHQPCCSNSTCPSCSWARDTDSHKATGNRTTSCHRSWEGQAAQVDRLSQHL